MTELTHYGTPRRSGRYPWGSGDNPEQRGRSLLGRVDELKRQGLSEKEIALAMGFKSTTQYRTMKGVAANAVRKEDAAQALRLRDKGMSNIAIGERMGIGESSVRNLLDPVKQERAGRAEAISSILRDAVKEKTYVDIGAGEEANLGVSRTNLNKAIAILQDEGYRVHYQAIPQIGTGEKTSLKILAGPETTTHDVWENRFNVKSIGRYSDDRGETFKDVKDPIPVSSKRVAVKYKEEGGEDKDGVIELRRGVRDITIGDGKNYAQVRVSVDGTHYLKGMAMYADDLPSGVDIRFNTNKSDTGNKLDAMKPMSGDPDLPFGAVIRPQRRYTDASGKEHQSALNIVNEEEDWAKWSKTLSSQMLSKQSPILAKRQLGLALAQRQEEFEEILSLTNPVIKKDLLQQFSDSCDSAAVHLKAAAMPRQRTHVILPITDMKETEIYAPNFRNGERVVLIRHPHGGIFEIPELTVNNKQQTAKTLLGAKPPDAVGIHPKVAARLSGADFDGDTVLVIPNNSGRIKTAAPLEGLKDFNPKDMYKLPADAPKLKKDSQQTLMGDVSNLITDMTIRGAKDNEIAYAVRHSMVVIDAEKHHLDYKRSYVDNHIASLKTKYQGGPRAGASTLVSLSKSEARPLDRKYRSAAEGGGIDPVTGAKVYIPTDSLFVNGKGNITFNTVKSTKMAEAKDAFDLSSGTAVEAVYATHANKLKAMANDARKTMLATQKLEYSPSAAETYAHEVKTLKAKLNIAEKNAPLERRAQALANSLVNAKKDGPAELDKKELKKLSGKALADARLRIGAKKIAIEITPDEWNAIQAGAISNHMLSNIIKHANKDKIKELALPRTVLTMTPAKVDRAKAMLDSGYTPAEVADALGVSVSTVEKALK